jgi:LmbE family N-acetylglucosaminyl deacetylase
VGTVVFLDHRDSGERSRTDRHPDAFVEAPVDEAAERVAEVAAAVTADALVTYDAGGVYGHPDHVHAHHVGRRAAELAGLPTWYEVTVDREHLHFVDTHVAALAGRSIMPTPIVGLTTVEISTTVDVSSALAPKLRAIGEHRSQVGDPTFGTGERFDDVYGLEWYVRHGVRGAIDDLGLRSAARPALQLVR